MLFQELQKTIGKIKLIEPQKDARAFMQELIANNADLYVRARDKIAEDKVRETVLLGASAGAIIKLIVPLPNLIARLTHDLRTSSNPAYIRLAVAGVLAHLVQPNDLIPDSAAGGYGFLDDSTLIHAAYAECLATKGASDEDATDPVQAAKLAAGLCPPNVVGALDDAVRNLTIGFQALSQAPPDVLEPAIQKLVANPHSGSVQTTVPATVTQPVAPGWSPQVGKMNALGMSLSSDGGVVSAVFRDGSSATLG